MSLTTKERIDVMAEEKKIKELEELRDYINSKLYELVKNEFRRKVYGDD